MNIITGNLFSLYPTDKKIIIPHCCNDIGGWGSGFVVPLRNKWAETERRYRAWYAQKTDESHLAPFSNEENHEVTRYWDHGTKFELGAVQFVPVEQNVTVANMIGQHQTIRTNNKPIRYLAIADAIRKVAEVAIEFDAQIHAPKFGAGLAGGDWKVIEALIQEAWVDRGISVTIYQLEE